MKFPHRTLAIIGSFFISAFLLFTSVRGEVIDPYKRTALLDQLVAGARYNLAANLNRFANIHKSNLKQIKQLTQQFWESTAAPIIGKLSSPNKNNSLAQISTNLPEEPPPTSSSNSLPSSSSPDLTPETNKISDLQALLQEVQSLIASGGTSQLQVVTPAAASSQLADLESSLLDLQNKQSKDYLALIRMIGQTGNIGQ
ncbi:MAG TPA: hypothetical protein VJH70_01920, partial [Candidatus Paceibacterota bacterium]